jgi:DNA segregation ATPase FtsK/SpoIIIE-like protein
LAQTRNQGKNERSGSDRHLADGGPYSGKDGTRPGGSVRTPPIPDASGAKSGPGASRTKAPDGSRMAGVRRSDGVRRAPGMRRASGARSKAGQARHRGKESASMLPPTPPLVRKEISAILLMAFGILLFMGIFLEDTAGSFGYALQVLAGGLFGITAWFLPFLVFGQGAYRMFSHSGHPLWNRFFNFILLLMLISAMFAAGAHPLSFYRKEPLFALLGVFFKEGVDTLNRASAQSFYGGGLFGGILGVPLLFVFQKAGAMVVLATLGIVVALIVTRISIMDAARSVARGTAGTLSSVVESSRRRREARLEMYESQSVSPAEMTTSQWFGKKTAEASPAKGNNAALVKLQPVDSGKKEVLQAKEKAARQRGGRFLEVEPFDPWDLPEDQEPDEGPTIQYPSSFVHIERDVGDLRIGREEAAGSTPSADAAAQPHQGPGTGENGVNGHDPLSDSALAGGTGKEAVAGSAAGRDSVAGTQAGSGKNQSGKDPKDAAAAMNSGNAGKQTPANPKIMGSAQAANGDPKLPGMPEKDMAQKWEDNLGKEEANRRRNGAAPALAEGHRADGLPDRPYTFPPVMLLRQSREDEQNMRRIRATADENARKLEATLESFGIGAKVIHISVGPAITRYELHPAPGIKVSRIVNLTDDIAMNLASSGVRIEAPIPGKAAIGVEVPNKEVAPISLRSVLESPEFEKHPSRLAVALGKDISGENMVVDLAKMPHLLIAGATGSGKSVCINSIVVSLLYKSKPEDVKLLMIDPKVVELGMYNGIPHLLIPVVTDPNKAAGALRWAVQEMIMRYKLFAEKGARDLAGFNNAVDETGTGMKLPQIVIIIDELADLMMVAPHDVEDSICRLAQMARAAGMHLVIATQRPSVNVITGVIKANIPSRVAFSVSSQVDSRTIIDMAGAEKLLGKGDMLYYPVGFPKPVRVKGAFITDKEVELVVDHVKAQMRVKYDEEIIDNINENQPPEDEDAGEDDSDDLLDQAIEALIDSGQASVSFIQRRFKVGYARAGRIIDQMAERGIISGYEGSKPRRVLITRDMWNEMRMQTEIRAAEASRNGREVEQQRMRMQAFSAARPPDPPKQEQAAVSAAGSAFLGRAMADAEERESHRVAYGDALPPSMADDGFHRLWTDPDEYREEID